jgi:TRAP-type C4-dicarboxylate transport system permease small subunit
MNGKNAHDRLAGRTTRVIWALLAATLALAFAGNAFAAGGGKAATKLINVADTRGMAPGLSMWIADIYNGNLWLFGFVVVVSMAGMGAILGYGFDKLIGLLGIRLGKLDHHE